MSWFSFAVKLPLFIFLTFSFSGFVSPTNAEEPKTAQQKSSVGSKPKIDVKVLQSKPLKKLQTEKKFQATLIELTLEPLASSPPHRHPGPVTGYVLEGTFEFQIGHLPVQTLKAGDTFFEPTMILHRVARNPDKKHRAKVLVTMIHPVDAKQLVIPEKDPK